MQNTLITLVQIFGIGFSFGIIGPCFLACTPVLLVFVTGRERGWRGSLRDVVAFLSGRSLAYLVLGLLAGLSAGLLRQFISSSIAVYFKPIAGVITIFLGISIFLTRTSSKCAHGRCSNNYELGGIVAFGFLVGIAPCAPLMALLFQITLMSRNALDGIMYAFAFGAGTFLSGVVVVGSLCGFLTWLPAKYVRSEKTQRIFRVLCAILLVLIGGGLIFSASKVGTNAF